MNHAWSGGGLTILSHKVCEISPHKPGYSAFQVLPQPAVFSEASASMETDKGTIKSSFKKTASGMDLNVTIPPASKAIIGIPDSGVKCIKLNGEQVWKKETYITNKRRTVRLPNNLIVIEVASGEWNLKYE